MALVFEEVWPTAAAGTMAASDQADRRSHFARGVTTQMADALVWSDDGTTSGNVLHATDPPLALVMMSGNAQDGEWSPVSCYGPVIDVTLTGGATGSRDLFFWALERNGSHWQTVIYSAGLDSGAFAQTQGRGRSFFAFLFG